jgi:uncharacterized Rossmann fold enzyme
LNLENKNIYLAPCNDITEQLKNFLLSKKVNVLGFIDNYKEESFIVKPTEIKSHDYIFIFSPNHWKSIEQSISSNNKVFVYYINEKYYFIPNNSTLSKCKIKLFYLIQKLNVYKQKWYRYRHNCKFMIAEKYHIFLTKNIANINKIKKHPNRRIFIIGNGPSLKIEHLERLKNELTIASNKIFLAFEETTWRPSYYTIEDPLDIKEYYDEILKYDVGVKFFPNKYGIKKFKNSVYYNLKNMKTYQDIYCSNSLFKGFGGGESVAFSMIEFAIFLECKEIYLIGFDHHYTFPSKTEEYVYKISDEESNHFHKNYRKKGDVWTEPRLDNITYQFQIIKDYCDKKGIEIYNATQGGKLEIFPRVEFESLFTQD